MMPTTILELSDQHLAIFEWFTKEWSSHFGVDRRWWIRVTWVHDSTDAFAFVNYDDAARLAIIHLNRKYESVFPFDEEKLAHFACHEVIHVLLAPLAELADQGLPRAMTSIGTEHEIVQTLTQISMRDHFDNLRARCPIKA
jgi:hypothetical protein